jgi:preprotein translocase subunit SecB
MKQQPVCELQEFFIHDLAVEWLNPEESESESFSLGFDYDLSCHANDPHLVRMIMRFWLGRAANDDAPRCPYSIHVEIEGFFSFPADLEEGQMAYLCRVNSMTILYGILRGEIANVTGSFPGGKYILPTVMMQDVVNEIEERKEKEREARQTVGGQEKK